MRASLLQGRKNLMRDLLLGAYEVLADQILLEAPGLQELTGTGVCQEHGDAQVVARDLDGAHKREVAACRGSRHCVVDAAVLPENGNIPQLHEGRPDIV